MVGDTIRALGEHQAWFSPVDDGQENGSLNQGPCRDDPSRPRRQDRSRPFYESVKGQGPGRSAHDITKPPSTLRAWPVMPPDSGSARNTAACPISWGSIMRRRGTRRL